VHQFLGNAADINAGSAQSPLGSLGRGFDKIAESHAKVWVGRKSLFGAGKTARTAANNDEIIVIFVLENKSRYNRV
jgi:hypothetical protein